MNEARESARRAMRAGGLDGDVVEREVYNRCVRRCRMSLAACSWGNVVFRECYFSAALSVVRNAARLREMMVSGVTASDAVMRPPSEVAPDVWEDILTTKKERDATYAVRLRSNTNMYRCGKCHGRECHYFSLQTRSGDEPMTVFVCCLDCGHRWRTEG